VVNDHKNKGNNGSTEKEDMLDVLLKLANDPNLEVKLTDDRVKGLMQNLIVGGTDTSATTVEWAVLELLKHPNILEKAKNELDQVIGNKRWVQESDFAQLPYIDSIIKETFRLHPLATLLAPHFATQDCKVNGYDILKGTMIFINTWSIGRDPQFWDEPEEFKPERFSGKNANADIKGHSFELLPFGAGRRRCPGYRLGLNVVRSTLANLLHGFVWKLPNDMKAEDICMDELYGLTTHPKVSLKLILEPRLPLNLY
jgi:cytochrome P450